MAKRIALVLSGGGAKGAFQVGVLDELISNRGVDASIIAGVSTGAIQALAAAQDDIPGLLAQWLSIRGNSSIYLKRGLGVAGGLLGQDAIYNARPLKRLLEDFADDEKLVATGKKLLLGVVNLGTGEYRSIHENTPAIHNWVYASSAMPFFFDPLTTVDANGVKEQWVDGGVRDVTPLSEAMKWNPDGIIVVQTSPRPRPDTPKLYPNLIKIALRAVDILQGEVSRNDTANAALINDLIAAREAQYRVLLQQGISGQAAAEILRPLDLKLSRYNFAPIRMIEPDEEYSETLDFDPENIRRAIDAGRRKVEDEWENIASIL